MTKMDYDDTLLSGTDSTERNGYHIAIILLKFYSASSKFWATWDQSRFSLEGNFKDKLKSELVWTGENQVCCWYTLWGQKWKFCACWNLLEILFANCLLALIYFFLSTDLTLVRGGWKWWKANIVAVAYGVRHLSQTYRHNNFKNCRCLKVLLLLSRQILEKFADLKS